MSWNEKIVDRLVVSNLKPLGQLDGDVEFELDGEKFYMNRKSPLLSGRDIQLGDVLQITSNDGVSWGSFLDEQSTTYKWIRD